MYHSGVVGQPWIVERNEEVNVRMTERWRDRFLRSFWLILFAILINVLAFSTTAVAGDRSVLLKPVGNGTENFIYLPMIFGPLPMPSDLEVTQGVQQPANPVTLIANRPTVVRYTLTSETAYSGVNAYLHGSNDGITLPGSPISAINNPRTLESSANRSNLNDTFNFELPTSWTNGSVELWGSASNGVNYDVVHGPITVSFRENDPLPVTVVPIAYTCNSGGTGTTTPASPFDYLVDYTFKIYPVPSVDLSEHVPVVYSGKCAGGKPDPTYAPGPPYDDSDWERLLSLITSIWQSEGAPNRYFYGVVESTCSGGCISGLGWLNLKAAVGFNGIGSMHNGASQTHAHEVGHNHGRRHAPGCGVGGADASYPYLDGAGRGAIGDIDNPNYGFDIANRDINVYSSFYDIMGYCGPYWISDYTFEALFEQEMAQAALPSKSISGSGDALFVSGFLNEDGSIQLQPAFQLDIPAAPSGSGEYTLELLDGDGALLSAHPFEISTAFIDYFGAGSDGEVQGFQLTIPHVRGIEKINAVRDGEVLGTLHADPVPTSLALDHPHVQIEGGQLLATWSAPVGTSHLVRLSLDNGTTWQTVAVNLREPVLQLPLLVSNTDTMRFEILSSDGIHTDRIEFGATDINR
jgi:hypothetical protein